LFLSAAFFLAAGFGAGLAADLIFLLRALFSRAVWPFLFWRFFHIHARNAA